MGFELISDWRRFRLMVRFIRFIFRCRLDIRLLVLMLFLLFVKIKNIRLIKELRSYYKFF